MKRIPIALLCCAPLIAGAQSDLVLDTASTQDAIVLAGTSASNGDQVLVLRGMDGVTVWRSTANGAPVWAREVGGPTQFGQPAILHADAANGVMLQSPMVQTYHAPYPGEEMVDTVRLSTVLTRLAPNGDMDWQREVNVTFGYPIGVMPWPPQLVATALGDGFVVVGHNSSYDHDDLAIVKLDLQGEVQYAYAFRRAAMENDNDWELRDVVADHAGGLYLSGSKRIGAGQRLFSLHMNANGELDWAKGWHYTNATVLNDAYGRAVTMPDGSMSIAGRMVIPGHDYLTTVRVDQSGNMVDASFYTHPPLYWHTKINLAAKPNGELVLGQDSVVVDLAADGNVLGAAVLESNVLGSMRNTFSPFEISAGPGGAVLVGVLNEVHVDLGYTYRKPAARMVDPGQPGCHMAPLQVERVVVPTALYVMQDLASYSPHAVISSVQDLAGTSVERDFIPINDLCEAMVITGMPEVAGGTQDLVNNIGRQGESFRLATAAPVRISVHDATGRFLVRDKVYRDGNNGIATTGWLPGMYWIRFTDLNGNAARTHRVVVVP